MHPHLKVPSVVTLPIPNVPVVGKLSACVTSHSHAFFAINYFKKLEAVLKMDPAQLPRCWVSSEVL